MKKDKYLDYYNQEMNYLRQAGARFAQYHPQAAERLKIDDNYIADPHTERLIESFAFLTSKINYKIDQNFSELAQRLLDVLYPHLTRPIPAMTVAKIKLRSSAYEGNTPLHFERHHPLYAISHTDKLHCHFRTIYPITIWPIHISYASIGHYHEILFNQKKASQYLGITLSCKNFAQLNCQELVFGIQAPLQKALKIHQAIFQHQTASVWMIKDDEKQATYLGDDVLEPIGLEEDDVILPTKYATNFTYHLLNEYFTFPEKFMFFKVKNLHHMKTADRKITLLFPMAKIDDHLGNQISAEDFAFDIVPIVNLFPMKTDPITLDHTQMEYRLSVDESHDIFYEIYNIEQVFCTKKDVLCAPFFDIQHKFDGKKIYWTSRRDSAQLRGIPGTDVFMSFISQDFQPITEDQLTIYANVLATNRDLINDVEKNTIFYSEHTQPYESIVCNTHPRFYSFQYEDGEYLWKLIAQLSLNHMSFSSERYSLDALKELIYLHAQRTQSENITDCIKTMHIKPAIRRLGDFQWRGFVRGLETTLGIENFETQSYPLFLLSMILHTFMSHHVAINSFVSLTLVDTESKENIMTWHPRVGRQKLL